MPKVSVIMPAYNAAKTIEDSIRSVLAQTMGDFELLVVDDCSKDETYDIMLGFAKQDARVVPLQNEKNSGVSHTRNYAVSEAKGEWIAFLDSDDMWRADKLEKQLKVMESHPDAVISYTASSFINAEGKPFGYVLKAKEKTSFSTLLRKNLLSCSSVMIKPEVMKSLKMPGDEMHEDYYTWLKVLKEHKYAYGVNEPLLIYRLAKNTKSSNRFKSARMNFNTYHAYGYNAVASFFLMMRYSVYSIYKRLRISFSKGK